MLLLILDLNIELA